MRAKELKKKKKKKIYVVAKELIQRFERETARHSGSATETEVGLLKAEIEQITLESELAVRNLEAESTVGNIQLTNTSQILQNEVAVGSAQRGKEGMLLTILSECNFRFGSETTG